MATTGTTRKGTRTTWDEVQERVDVWASTADMWWRKQQPRMRVGLAIAAVFAAAGVLNLLGSVVTRTSTPATATAQPAAPRASGAAPSLASEAAPSDAGKAWSVVKVWQGSSASETESFTVGQHWRVDWLFNPTQPTGQLQVYIYAADGRLLLNVAAATQKAGPDSTFWAGPGTYFLKVNSSGGDWKIAVQDLR